MATFDVSVAGIMARIILPSDFVATNCYHMIVWHHGGGSDRTSMPPEGDPITAALLTKGYILCSSDAHFDNWGNGAGLADYENLVAYVRATYNINHLAFWGGSMGGCCALLAIARNVINGIKGAFQVFPVCSIHAVYGAAVGGVHDASINAAYNIPAGGDFETQTAGHDALLFPASVYTGKRFRFTHSPDDTIVPKATNSDAFAAYVSGVAAEITVLPISGQHGVQHGMIVEDVVAFFERCCRLVEPERVSTSSAVYAPAVFAVLDVPTLVTAIQVHPPAINYGDAGVSVPVLMNSMQVFPPASVAVRGRPLAEDIRIMRVRRAE